MNNKCPCEDNICSPVIERPVEKCIQKDIIHEIKHICPINTKIINNHIYRHVYVPQYNCCEEDVITNEDECCNNFYQN